MTPKLAMQEVLAQVETVTGYPVQVLDDPALTVLATVKVAKAQMPFTLIRVRPDTNREREYVVCFQCGFVLRQASLRSEDRWDIGALQHGRMELEREIRKVAAGKLYPRARSLFVENLLGGLIVQLRSVPIGLRIDTWLRDQFPVLADQQRRSIERQLNDNLAVLSPNIKRMAPEKVYSASAAMNAAAAVYWAAEWGDNKVSVPYLVTGLLEGANKLLDRFRDVDDGAESDRKLIDAWAEELGIAGWYEFISR